MAQALQGVGARPSASCCPLLGIPGSEHSSGPVLHREGKVGGPRTRMLHHWDGGRLMHPSACSGLQAEPTQQPPGPRRLADKRHRCCSSESPGKGLSMESSICWGLVLPCIQSGQASCTDRWWVSRRPLPQRAGLRVDRPPGGPAEAGCPCPLLCVHTYTLPPRRPH